MTALGGVSQSALSLQHVQPGRIQPRLLDRDGDGDRDGQGPESIFADAAAAAGVDKSKIPGLLDQIKQAIEASKGDGPPNPATLRDTVHNVLQANGVDVETFDAALQAPFGAGSPDPALAQQAAQLTPEQQSMLTLLEQSVTGKGYIVDTQA